MAQAQLGSTLTRSDMIERIYTPVKSDLLKVQASLLEIVTPETELLVKTIHHSLQNNGKLMRPLLTLLASGACGEIGTSHIETAAVAELIHVATLLHDDVLDDADIRRGRPTVRVEWGNRVSILSGDYLLAQASLKLSRLNQCRLVSIFAQVLANLCEGEVEQIRTSYDIETTWDSYYKKSICKTAALYAACCESAGVINRLPEERIEDLRLFGEKFGIAFQIIDDLLDYTSSSERLGKPVLDDMKNGLLNAPILLALESFAPGSAELDRLVSRIEAIFHAEDNSEHQRAVQDELFDLLETADALEKTMALARRFTDEARAHIDFLEDSPYKASLHYLTDYVCQRDY